MNRKPAGKVPPENDSDPGSVQLRILLIEDDEDDYVVIRALLSEAPFSPYHLEWAKTYDAGIAALRKGSHDICLLDYSLGDRNGIDLLHEISSMGVDTPVIFLTGYGDYNVDFRAMKAGVSDYLIKHQLSPELLERSIRYAMEHRRTAVLLQRERGNLMGILESMDDAVFIISALCDFEYLNPVAERVFGPIEARKCYNYFHSRETACPWCKCDDVIKGGETLHLVWVNRKNRATYDIFETPLRHIDGTVSCLSIFHDITRHKMVEESLRLDEARLEALLELAHMTDPPIEQIAGFVLDQGVKLTKSKAGWLGFMGNDEKALTVQAMSAGGVDASRPPRDLPFDVAVESECPWADALRERRAVIVNDLSRLTLKSCFFEHYMPLVRLLSVPVLDGNRVVAIAVAGNKEEEYDSSDVRQITLLMDGMWKLIQRRKHEDALRESEKRLRFLAFRLLNVQEEEKSRLAREMHDRTGQTLAAIKFGVENALRATGRGKAKAMSASLEVLVPMIQDAIEDVRTLYMGLRPTILDDLGVVAAIGWFCREFGKSYPSISIAKEAHVEEKEVPDHLRIVIFRIVQEAFNNAARHSKADRLDLYLDKADGSLELMVRDNGTGFDLKETLSVESTRGGLGLAGIKERAELSGGSFTIESHKGEGTTIHVTWSGK